MKKINIHRSDLMSKVLWVVFVAALVSSVKHVAWAFGTLEFEGEQWFGWIPALAVDAGLAAIAYGIHQRKKAKRPTRALWFGLFFFSAISIIANVMHGSTVNNGIDLTTIVLSATLPIMVIYLGDIVSSDDVQLAKKNEQTDERVQRLKDELNAFKEKAEQERSSLVQTIQGLNTELNTRSAEIERLNTTGENSVSAEQNGWHEEWIVYLTEHPSFTQRELAEHFKVSVGTVNTRLRKLNGAVKTN